MYTFTADKKKWLRAIFIDWLISTVAFAAIAFVIVFFLSKKTLSDRYIYLAAFLSLFRLFNLFYRIHVRQLTIDTNARMIYISTYRLLDGVQEKTCSFETAKASFKQKGIMISHITFFDKWETIELYQKLDGFSKEEMNRLAQTMQEITKQA